MLDVTVVMEVERRRLQAPGMLDEHGNVLTEALPNNMLPSSKVLRDVADATLHYSAVNFSEFDSKKITNDSALLSAIRSASENLLPGPTKLPKDPSHIIVSQVNIRTRNISNTLSKLLIRPHISSVEGYYNASRIYISCIAQTSLLNQAATLLIR